MPAAAQATITPPVQNELKEVSDAPKETVMSASAAATVAPTPPTPVPETVIPEIAKSVPTPPPAVEEKLPRQPVPEVEVKAEPVPTPTPAPVVNVEQKQPEGGFAPTQSQLLRPCHKLIQ